VGYQLRSLLETKFGNLINFTIGTVVSYGLPGVVVAWLRMAITYRFMERSKK
jgi:hypothetical protein